MNKNLIFTAVMALLLVSIITFTAYASNVEIKDIAGHWASQGIQYMANLGIVKGYPDGTYKPENLMTRGEFASALCNLLKEAAAEPSTFKDVPKDHWAGKYVGTLQKKGVIWDEESYLNDGFNIDGNITRLEIAKMLIRTSPKAVEVTKDEEVYYSLTDYKDYYNLDDVTKRYIGILYSSQIMRGFPDYTFKLDQPATRAEIVTLLEKFLENRGKLDNPTISKKPQTGIVGNMYYVDKLELPQYLRAYNQLRDITDEELPLKFHVDRVSLFNYDNYNEDTTGYSPEYKDLMERYQVLWKKFNEEGNRDIYSNNWDAFQPDEVKDLAGKNLLCVEYTVENTTPYPFTLQSQMVGPKLLTQKNFDEVKQMQGFLDFNLFIFDNLRIEQWENGSINRPVRSDAKTYHMTAFYYVDYVKKMNIRDYQLDPNLKLEDIKYIGFYNPGNWLYNVEDAGDVQTQRQALLMKLEE